ncbi:hypothetical protein GUJ93_ZPchr0015g6854 [Zizania palustris]|uniref:Uncharacterized protein n=1 Tax=Zizania palustris TaxID=103762 RepID=A0A8J5TLY7_ZIZPA|nr:hypothetical protein GUJ93_ZPchr0015g6854 [Zizania palustris]
MSWTEAGQSSIMPGGAAALRRKRTEMKERAFAEAKRVVDSGRNQRREVWEAVSLGIGSMHVRSSNLGATSSDGRQGRPLAMKGGGGVTWHKIWCLGGGGSGCATTMGEWGW